MLEVKFVRDNIELVRQMLRDRRSELDLQPLLDIDELRRRILVDVEDKKHRRNVASDSIAQLKKEKKDASGLIEEMKGLSQQIKGLDQQLTEVEQQFRDFLLNIPNVPHKSVPVGHDENDNKVIKFGLEKPSFAFTPKPHWEIGEDLGILDFERGAKITGARFTLYWGAGAALERALIAFMLDVPYFPSRLYGSASSFHGEQYEHDGHWAVAEIQGRPVQGRGLGLLACAYRRGPGDEYSQQRDPRRI